MKSRPFAIVCVLAICSLGTNVWAHDSDKGQQSSRNIFSRSNLVAWCIVPFDSKKRGPAERAEMIKRLGLARVAYDWRAQHVATFEEEILQYRRHGIEYFAFWSAHEKAFDLFEKHKLHPQIWQTLSSPPGNTEAERIAAAAKQMLPLVLRTRKVGSKLGLYNHGGWGGEPANLVAVCKHLRQHFGADHVGIVYNLHHGHDHIDDFAQSLALMKPYLLCLNLNGMTTNGDKTGRKILPLGAGEHDVRLIKIIRDSGYDGAIGIIGHTQDDVEQRLLDNLDGLDWILPQLDGKPAGPKPHYRTQFPLSLRGKGNGGEWAKPPLHGNGAPAPDRKVNPADYASHSPHLVAKLIDRARHEGDAHRGLMVFSSATSACLSCHKVGKHGGTVGPELTSLGKQSKPADIVEAVLWPKRHVKPEYIAHWILTDDGRSQQGYIVAKSEQQIVLRDPTRPAQIDIAIPVANIELQREVGTLMPDNLIASMSERQLVDLLCFLLDIGANEKLPLAQLDALLAHAHIHAKGPATFAYERKPLHLQHWPSWQHRVNRDRVYDFYTRQAEHFRQQSPHPVSPEGRGMKVDLLAEFPGLDGGKLGHWGNQNDDVWADERWNDTDLGTLQCGVFRHGDLVVPRGVCVRLGDDGEMAACFNPDTLTYDAVWSGGFVKFSRVRHGFMHGLQPQGTPKPRPASTRPDSPFVYHGFYRVGKRVVFSYRSGDEEMLDSPWVENGAFTRLVAPADRHPLRQQLKDAPSQWTQHFVTPIKMGTTSPLSPGGRGARGEGYVVDTVQLPFDNPWKALLFCGGHAFLPDGSALVCTMQGDVWRVEILDRAETEGRSRWRRIAAGLHQALGILADDDGIFVLGRDQITRLHDLNGDGEMDFYECFSNAYQTSPAGHDFICGLERDRAGNFYTASGNQGLVRIAADGKRAQVLATGFRNPDGLGVLPDGLITVPCSEGDWTPASMICAFRPSDTEPPFFGYHGPLTPFPSPPGGEGKGVRGKPPHLPMVYLPRGLDNSSGGQTYVTSDRWGPLAGQLLHFSFGAGAHFLVLRDEVDGQIQGAVVPLPGEFRSGAHRGRFNPHDGQLYVTGMQGWGSYTPDDGCFQRVRYTGDPVQLPVRFHVHRNGVAVTFSSPLDASAGEARNHFAQCWNYRYSGAYGSPEFSTKHFGIRGHDVLTIASATVLADQRTLFLEMPDLQPVNQLHLRVASGAPGGHDLFLTVHKLGEPFTQIPNYTPRTQPVQPHPILADMALLTKSVLNPYRRKIAGARRIMIETGSNLSFATRSFKARAGETIEFTLSNPDVVPHNWALIKPGALDRVGAQADRLISDPDAVFRHYIPESTDVLAYTDVVLPGERFTIFFKASEQPGRYPFLCTFPGHWKVMNGEMIVER